MIELLITLVLLSGLLATIAILAVRHNPDIYRFAAAMNVACIFAQIANLATGANPFLAALCVVGNAYFARRFWQLADLLD